MYVELNDWINSVEVYYMYISYYICCLMSFFFSCQANVSLAQIRNNKTETSCEIDERPSLAAAIVHIFAFFGAGVAMSSWSWTEASLEAWKRLLSR